MFHTVFFWLKDDLTEEQRTHFESELSLLPKIPYLAQGHVSKPAATAHREGVTDHSFDFSLILEFKNLEDHEKYQTNDADHDRFVEQCKEYWKQVQVRDSEPLS